MVATLSERELLQPASWGSANTAQSTATTSSLSDSEGRRGLLEFIGANVDTQLSRLRQLQPDWDSYGAPPVDAAVLLRVRAFLTDVLSANLPAPYVVPTAKGGITLEWHRGERELIVELVPEQSAMDAFFADDEIDAEWELPLPADGLFVPALVSMEGRE